MPRALLALALAALLLPLPGARAETLEMSPTVVIRAAAVSETSEGFVGSTATISITSAANGSGHIFVDTFPLTQVDMQGSARLAARVAAQLSGKDLHAYDFFFVVRSSAEQIGGPSAGAAMTVGAIATLNEWKVRDDALMTGTINPDATVGPVGGIAEKAAAAAQAGITRFLFPSGQEVVPLGDARIVNMTDYCRDELGIDCVPVAEVIDAVALMTDHVIERPVFTGNVTGEGYRARLGPLGAQLVADAVTLVDEAADALAAAPEGATKAGLVDQLTLARNLTEKSRREVANGSYYTAASTSFQASIEARYVRIASLAIRAPDLQASARASLEEAQGVLDAARGEIEASRVVDTNSFEAVGAAQVRLLEAERRMEAARVLVEEPRTAQDLFEGLHGAAYAAARAQTADWWLQLSEGFPEGEKVEDAALQESARDAITTSREEVTYVEAVFENAGVTGALEKSQDLLDDADEAMTRRFYAGAMLDALEASVRASVALEIAGFGGNVPESKIETARENAARAIQGARARGVESLLAQSAYEFGLSLPDPADQLSFLGLARVTGNLAGLPGLFAASDAVPTMRFQGDTSLPYRIEVVYVAAAFAVGIALGVGAGLTAMMPRKPDEEEGPA